MYMTVTHKPKNVKYLFSNFFVCFEGSCNQVRYFIVHIC